MIDEQQMSGILLRRKHHKKMGLTGIVDDYNTLLDEIGRLTKERDEYAEDARRNDDRIARLVDGNTRLQEEVHKLNDWILTEANRFSEMEGRLAKERDALALRLVEKGRGS